MSSTPDEYEDLPDLNEEPDNDPDDTAEYQAVTDGQDPEGTERPEVDKHPEDE